MVKPANQPCRPLQVCNRHSKTFTFFSNEIRPCQSRAIKVMLSIEGGIGSESLSSTIDKKNVADYLWNNFLGGKSFSHPSGDAVLDSIRSNMSLVQNSIGAILLTTFKAIAKLERPVYLTAAPQHPFPDRFLGNVLQMGLFDYGFSCTTTLHTSIHQVI